MRRPRKKPSLVVFCLIFAVSPCSEVFRGSSCFKDVSWAIFGSLPPGPLGDRLAGGTGGIWLLMSLLLSARIGTDCPSIELANFGKEGKPEPMIAKISQQTLAEMIGTTRSRVSFFMNKFRRLGF